MIQCVEVLFVWCIWLYVLIMSRTRFRLNPHSLWMSKLPECQRSVYRVWIDSETCTWHVRTYSQMHRTYKYSQHSSIIWPVWLNDWVSVRLRTKWLWVPVQLQSLNKWICLIFLYFVEINSFSSFDLFHFFYYLVII